MVVQYLAKAKIIACTEDALVIQKILKYLGLAKPAPQVLSLGQVSHAPADFFA